VAFIDALLLEATHLTSYFRILTCGGSASP